MATSTKKTWRLGEFEAHVGSVNCLALGHNSGRVMVTGGEDKKVNMWAVGKPDCILSLSGHTTPVESVKFNNTENQVIAGSLSGALKIWDLESVKIIRTLMGHKSTVRTMDFHPYAEYVASASLDTNIKLWDIRRKGCIFTYKHHTNAVNYLQFSPDGRWIVSAGEDGLVILWDLSAGKPLGVFRQHAGPVNAVAFHPNEFFLASGSNDRTVKFWDLESMQMVCSSDGDSMPVRSLVFHPDALCLYAGCENQLKVYGWEPAECLDSLVTGWGRVADVAFAQNQLIGASFSQSNVSVYVADIERIAPLGGTPVAAVSRPATSSSRRSFIADRHEIPAPIPSRSKEDIEEAAAAEEAAEDTPTVAEVPDPQKYQEVFHPRHKLNYSPPVSVKKFPAPLDDGLVPSAGASGNSRTSSTTSSDTPLRPDQFPIMQPAPILTPSGPAAASAATSKPQKHASTHPKKSGPPRSSRSDGSDNQNTHIAPRTRRSPLSNISDGGSTAATPTPPAAAAAGSDRDVSSAPRSKARDDFTVDIRVGQQRRPIAESGASMASASDGDVKSLATMDVPSTSSMCRDRQNHKSGFVNPEDFVQSSAGKLVTDSDVMSMVRDGHNVMLKVLSSRNSSLQVVKAMWSSGNVKTALESALHMNELSVTYDVISLMLTKTNLWTLDLCVLLVPALNDLLNSKYNNYIRCALDGLKLLLRQFAPIIKSNISVPPTAGVGVDISREERYNKCMSCYKLLMNVRSNLENKLSLPDQMSDHLRELRLLMGQLD